MTPAVKLLDKLNISYTLHQYHHDEAADSYGQEAADKLAVASEQIFKTLIVETEHKALAVAIVPVDRQLNLKNTAKALKCKKLHMADPKRVQTSTGYVLGGVSPLGQKKRLTTIIDDSSKVFDSIFISGGKRGLEIEISPIHLADILRATFSSISS